MNPPILGHRRRGAPAAAGRTRLVAGAAAGALVAVALAVPAASAVPTAGDATQPGTQQSAPTADVLAEQVLTFTGSNSVTEYASAPTTATAGPATIVFENSVATGNTIGMSHTLTFDTTTPGYNHDVDLDILANPFDSTEGRHEVEVTLTPGTYRYFCAIPGHGTMVGELVVTDGSGGEDTTAPTVTADVTGSQDADGAYVGSATVTLNASDAESEVESVEYEVDGGGFQPYTEPFDVTAPGEHTVTFRATDTAGNTSEAATTTFTVVEETPEDVVAPTVTADVTGEQDADGSYVGSATVTLTATDDDSGVASVEYDLDDAGFTEYTEPVELTEPGMHMLSYRATDQAGNVSEAAMVHVVVVAEDTTAPSVTAEVTGEQDADGSYVGSATVTLAATDDESGVDTVEYDLDGAGFAAYTDPVVVTAPGEHTLGYRATDAAGNVSEAGSVTFTVVGTGEEDTTAPVVAAEVTGELDDDGAYVGTATVALTATDEASAVESVEYDLDGDGFTAYDEPFDVTTPGEHTVRYRATDAAGNVSEPGAVTFTVAEPVAEDTTPPAVTADVTGEQDGDGAYVGSATVALSATDEESGVASVEYDLDGSGFMAYTDPVVIDAAGEHTLTYRATDEAGNVSEPSAVDVVVVADDGEPDDTAPPFVAADLTGDRDDDGAYVGEVSIEITATDEGSGVAGIEYALDQAAFTAYTGPVTVSDPGAHTLRYRATDDAGNTSTTQTLPFLVSRAGTDVCPASDERETVIVGGVDSGVANVDTGDGCTVADLVDADGEYANHGAFVSHVRDVATTLADDGTIDKKDRPKLVRAAARSDVGKG
ncbi:OmpL47-type beta-barrel domain-containing protein [Isoptericola sp. BMS4]|uniref:OmpL47-type beta-barrel domain-containing protein n=1 Tax=Isoptericola sp. BMS4 TaxID=2527875 RepID=UPI0014223590|nr:hypothetical protein [Isoptericola sp. BMS4]